jgi:hypothetical protein
MTKFSENKMAGTEFFSANNSYVTRRNVIVLFRFEKPSVFSAAPCITQPKPEGQVS